MSESKRERTEVRISFFSFFFSLFLSAVLSIFCFKALLSSFLVLAKPSSSLRRSFTCRINVCTSSFSS